MNAGTGTRTRRWLVLAALGAVAALPAVPAGAETRTVSLKDNSFDPRSLTVAAGDTVVWTNDDDQEHTVTSDNQSGTGAFDSSPTCQDLLLSDCMDKGETFSHRFDVPGDYGYHCEVHLQMTGTVTVVAATTTTAAPTTTEPPTTTTTARATTTTRQLATSSTQPSSTTTTALPEQSTTTMPPNEAPAFDPDDDGGQDETAAPAGSRGGGSGSGTVAVIVAALLAVAGGGGVLLWRLRPRAG